MHFSNETVYLYFLVFLRKNEVPHGTQLLPFFRIPFLLFGAAEQLFPNNLVLY